MGFVKELVFANGEMAVSTTEAGTMVHALVRAHIQTHRETCMMVVGKMTSCTDRAK